jgi:general secretion pathway protein D
LVKFFGTNSLGEVLTSPDVTVRDGRKGRIQVGTDIFVGTRDIAGNTVNTLISTGTIIEVTPMIYSQADTEFIYLDISIEQSEASEGPKISRSVVKTHALLYDGEETVIGGLVHTLDVQTREGIPILKDLPWWFLGLRYIFGSDSKQKVKNELIILLKAELSKPIRDRMLERRTRQEIIDKKRDENKKEFDKNE